MASGPSELDLSVAFGDLSLPSPVVLASGTCGYGEELLPFGPLEGVGGVVLKGVTPEPRPGNAPPRLAECQGGLLNSIGLQNPGLEVFVADVLPRVRRLEVPLIANVSARAPEEYQAMAERLGPETGLAALEVNVSCPNRTGEAIIGTSPEATEAVVRAVVSVARLPVLVKLSPEAGFALVRVAEAARRAGAAGLTVANTFRGLAVDVAGGRLALGAGIGGYSGPAVKPLVLRMVYEVSRAVSLPVFGCGGVATASDALEYFMAGATAVQVGTATMVDPTTAGRVLAGVAAYLRERGFPSVRSLTGLLHQPLTRR